MLTEVKMWYKTGEANGPVPAKRWEEFETLLFYADAHSIHRPCFNIDFEAEWHVEYRDLKRAFKNIYRETQNTQVLGATGTLADMYPHFPPPPTAQWPVTRNLDLNDIKHIETFLQAKETY